ncbi:hypothetical protein [Arthrobacter cryoconiti]|uniref:TrbC/VIRB2 family protein n=1 Tax=Arthrobacter cryoconiti TaxID=748907 RepID=A0ABV8R5H2_9MICC|nr:hypothetical protein [Arthrobacter cryoconiti]MCC9069342.1 hypothetical protein [Arthrobacter cryoconiti]
MKTVTIITTAVQPSAGMWDLINEQMTQAKGALIAASIIGAIVIILGTAVKTKAIMATLIAAVIGAALIFLASGGLELLSGKMNETVAASSSHELVLHDLTTDASA